MEEHAASAADPKFMAVGLGRCDQIQLDLSEAAGDAGECHGPANTAGLGFLGLCHPIRAKLCKFRWACHPQQGQSTDFWR